MAGLRATSAVRNSSQSAGKEFSMHGGTKVHVEDDYTSGIRVGDDNGMCVGDDNMGVDNDSGMSPLWAGSQGCEIDADELSDSFSVKAMQSSF